MTHILHDDIVAAGLASGCDRCEELAREPWKTLDDENLRRLLVGEVYTDLDREAAVRLLYRLGEARGILQRLNGLGVSA